LNIVIWFLPACRQPGFLCFDFLLEMAGKLNSSIANNYFMIQRDGTRTSLWQNKIPIYHPLNDPDIQTIYDVAIVGGGITGITAGLLLQNAGKKCLVVEANNLCFGSTGGTTAHLNTLLDTPYTTIIKNFGKENAQLVAKAAAEAIDLVKANIATYKIDCEFEEASAYLFSQSSDQSEELDEIYEACQEVGLDVSYNLSLPVNIEFEKAIEVRSQGKFHPVKYVYALAKAFEDAGGVILQHTRVTSVEDNEGITVETANGNFRAANLIYATHIPPGVNLVHLRCAPWRSYAMAFTLRNRKYLQDLLYDMYDPYHYIRSQKIDGMDYMIVGGEDHKTGHAENAEASFLKLESYVRKYFEADEILFKWSSQYFEAADGLPYIGHLPGHPGNIFVATGYGGNGMTYSNVAATVLQRMILKGESPYIKLFDPNRIKPVAGFTSFIKQNVDVLKKFVGKWFDKEKLEEFAELAPGEGKVTKFNGEKLALYKDEHGELHAINPICTHLKCSVAWNSAEQSWDCPCHGARYSPEGKVLTGPADHDLEKVEVKTLIEH
jgi:glycine/D-amino acid oxidase-like deaminating enzyme/nitrite reductase/ring-hydroxylating ferredoxin subunit